MASSEAREDEPLLKNDKITYCGIQDVESGFGETNEPESNGSDSNERISENEESCLGKWYYRFFMVVRVILALSFHFLLPCVMIVIGAISINQCPVQKMLPVICLILGCLFLFLAIVNRLYYYLELPEEIFHVKKRKIFIFVNVIVGITFTSLLGLVYYWMATTDFGSKDDQRCNGVQVSFWNFFPWIFFFAVTTSIYSKDDHFFCT